MKKFFCTFADSRMRPTLRRIERQVKEACIFDVVLINDETDLSADFREQFKERLIKGSRGFGYWVWKPQIILQALRQMVEGDLLLYLDAGCHFNKNGTKRLDDYFEMAIRSPAGMVVFQSAKESDDKNLIPGTQLESSRTKGDVFDFFGVRDDKAFYASGQVQGGTLILRKCKASEDVLCQWLDILKNNVNLVDDSPSVSLNFPDFKENRHDQSILSIICKKKGIPSVSTSETYQEDWELLKMYPLWAKRDKTLSSSFFARLKKKIKVFIERSRI